MDEPSRISIFTFAVNGGAPGVGGFSLRGSADGQSENLRRIIAFMRTPNQTRRCAQRADDFRRGGQK